MSYHTAYIGIGTNVSPRSERMKSALERLASNWQIIASSGTYITEPVGFTEQQEFLNAAVKFRCEEEPLQLFQRLKELEAELGRIARERWHEREIDFDILFYDDLILKSDILTIPHPEALRRNFVLIPLIEIAPDLHDPASGRTIADIAKDLVTTSDGIRKLPDDEIVL